MDCGSSPAIAPALNWRESSSMKNGFPPARVTISFVTVSGTGFDADELARRLLDEAGVAVLAGSAFGQVGRDNLRLSYANSQANLGAALERMRAFLADNGP